MQSSSHGSAKDNNALALRLQRRDANRKSRALSQPHHVAKRNRQQRVDKAIDHADTEQDVRHGAFSSSTASDDGVVDLVVSPRSPLDRGKNDPFAALPTDLPVEFLTEQVHMCKVPLDFVLIN
jgi:hypothetical protein